MTDLEAVAAICPDIDLPTDSELAAARQLLADAMAQEMAASSAAGTDIRPLPRPVPLRRRHGRATRLAVAGVVALAACLLAVLVATGGAPTPLQRTGTARIQLAAMRFLDKAAVAALQQPSAPPQPNQFVYSETEESDGTLTETWLSADGSSDGLMHWLAGPGSPDAGASGGHELGPSCSIAEGEAGGCVPIVGYYPGMPTDPNEMLAYLNEVSLVDTENNPTYDALPGWEDNVVGKTVAELMSSSYLLPAQQDALLKVMAATPGFQVVSPMSDATGRPGVGIEWSFEGGVSAIIFDPTTYAYLGDRTWPKGQPANPSDSYDGDALVKQAVVASAGEQP
jgi:hypothetical protein